MTVRRHPSNNRHTGLIAAMLAGALLMLPTVAQAQTDGGWTLNIDNTGFNPIQAGALLPYTVRINNNDNVAKLATTITFDIPPTADYVGVTGLANCLPAPASGQPATVTCDVPPLAPNAVANATVNLRPMQEGTISLRGAIPAPGPSFSRSTTVQKGADLSVAIAVNPAIVQAGSNASFTATLSNAGPYDANDAKLVIPVPAGLSPNFQLPSGCSIAANTITCTLAGPIAVGASFPLTFTSQVTTGNASTISVAASVTSTAPRDGNPTNNDAAIDITVIPGTDVSLSKTRAPQGLILTGDTVTFTLDPRFAGLAPSETSIQDIVPANYQVIGVNVTPASGWTCPVPGGQAVTCTYQAAQGTDYTRPITITAKAVTATPSNLGVTNTATISSPNENADASGNNTANDGAAFIADPTIDLVAYKSGPPRGLVTVGNSYEFTLRSRNEGNAPFSDELTITDHLPAGMEITAASLPPGWSCTPALPMSGPGNFSCATNNYVTAPLLPTQQTPAIALTVKVTAAGPLVNGMTVSFAGYDTGGDSEPANNTTTVGLGSADADNWADVSVEKTQIDPAPGATIKSGDLITFQIEIRNTGPATALDVVLNDRLNDIVSAKTGGLPLDSHVVVTPSVGVGSAIECSFPNSSAFSKDLQCVIPQLPMCTPGNNCPRVTVTMRTGGQGPKTNTAIAFSTLTPDNDTTNNQSSVNYTVDKRTDVTVDKSSPVSGTGAKAGQELIYVLTAIVPRTGLSDAENVTVTDTLPNGLVFKSAAASTGSCAIAPSANAVITNANNQLVCNLGTLVNGSQQTVTVRVVPTTAIAQIPAPGNIVTNQVVVSTSTEEPDTTNNSAQLPIQILPSDLDLIITKVDSIDPVLVGTDTVYTITVRNTGPSDSYNLTVLDTLPPAGMVNPRVVAPNDAVCTVNVVNTTTPGGTISCERPQLAANATWTIQVAMTGSARGRHDNNVTVTSDETRAGYEGPTDNNSSYEDTTVRERVDLLVTKIPSVTVVDLRKEFFWDITVTNKSGTGLGVADQVRLVDTLPVGMELTRVPDLLPSSGSCTGVVGGREIVCELGDMAAGAVVNIRLYTKITALTAQAAANSATATTLSFEQDLADNTGTGSVTTVQGSTISGRLYRDFNVNDQADAQDTGIGNINITLSGIAEHDKANIDRTVTTNADGTYTISELPPGTYAVSYGAISEQNLIDGKALPGGAVAGQPTPMASGVNSITGIVTVGNSSAVNHDFTRVPVPRIGITKTVGAVTVQPDGSLYIPYTVTVNNPSLEPVTGISVSDPLDGSGQNFGTFVSGIPGEGQYTIVARTGGAFGTLNASYNGSGDKTLLTAGTLAVGASGTMAFTVHVNPVVPRPVPSRDLTNQASTTGSGDYSAKPVTATSNITVTTPVFAPAIVVTKTATPRRIAGDPAVGDIVDYTFTVRNSGNTPLIDVTLTDPLPGLIWTSQDTIARLNPGASDNTSYRATYALTQADLDNGKVDNTVTATGQWGVRPDSSSVEVSSTGSASVPSLSKPGLTLVKSLDSAAAIGNPRTSVGEEIVYSFVITNTGNTNLKNVKIVDLLPGVTADPAGAFTIDDLAPRETRTVSARYPVKQTDIDAAQAVNTASANGTHGPADTPISTPNSSVTVPLFRQTSVALVKTLTSPFNDVPRAGDTVTWSVRATNTGNTTLSNLVVTDVYPNNTVSPTILATLAPGAFHDFTVTAPLRQQDINAQSLQNTATLNYNDPAGPGPAVDASTQNPLPAQTPDIALKKTADLSLLSAPPKAGETILYTIVIRNTGNVPLDTLTLSDLLAGVALDPADMAALAVAVLQPQNAAGNVLLADTDITVKASYVLKTVDIEAGKVINTAVTTGNSVPKPAEQVTDSGGTTFETDDPTETVLNQAPQISLSKAITNAALSVPPAVGDVITYGFTVTNTGNVNLTTISLSDAVADVVVNNLSAWNGPLAPAESNTTAFTATYALKQSDIDAGTFVNSATVKGWGIGPAGTAIEVTAPSSATQALNKVTGLTLVKSETSALSTPPKVGDRIDYSFVLTNTGNTTLSNVVVNDPLPGLLWDTASTVTTLLPGSAEAVTLKAHYILLQSDIQNGKVDNQAIASFDDPSGPQPQVPSNPVTVPLSQIPGIAVVKAAVSGLNDPAVAGEVITYSFTVTNTGNLELKGIVLADPLPRITPSSFAVGDLLPGETSPVFTATYAIDAADIAAKEVVNQATATGTYDDGSGPQTTIDLSGPTLTTDEPLVVPVLPSRPELVIVKTGSFASNGAYVYVGDIIDYSFEITNLGNVPLSNVTPRELGITFGGQQATGSLEAISPAPQTMAPGDKALFSTRYVMTQDDINNAAGLANGVANRAEAIADFNGVPIIAPPSDAVLSIPTQEPANVSLAKRALVSTIRRGETAGFAITVTNHSLADVGLVTITDRMPSGFVFVEGTATVNGVDVTPIVAGQVVTFTDVRLRPSSTVEIGLVLRALPTTPAGVYRNHADGVDAQGTPLAPRAHADVRIEVEGLFECSEVIGTVYNDLNRNGYQDQDEPGIPGVRLSTVRGTLITTDAFGRYSVPCADLPNGNIGSNFVLKIDERTLPSGFSMTTDNPGMVRLTAGKMVELNFGASIGREIRLTLDASAFVGGSVTPGTGLQTGLNQVIALLDEHRTTLFIRYRRGADPALAQQRVEQIVALIREQWRHAGEPYRLVINTDIVEN